MAAYTFNPSTCVAEVGLDPCEFKAILVYRPSSRTDRVTQRSSNSNKQTNNKTKEADQTTILY